MRPATDRARKGETAAADAGDADAAGIARATERAAIAVGALKSAPEATAAAVPNNPIKTIVRHDGIVTADAIAIVTAAVRRHASRVRDPSPRS
jgi:hypothetical protein